MLARVTELTHDQPVRAAWAWFDIAEIRELVKSNSSDIARLRQLASDLQQIAHALASTAYSRAASAGAQGGGTGNARSGSGDDVNDAEFKQIK